METCLRNHPGGLTEHQLLRVLEDDGCFVGRLNADPTLALFQKHFSVMHCLYRLQSWYRASGWELVISPLCIQLFETDQALEAGREISEFSDNLRGYYLDWRHFTEATPETVTDLLRDFWQRFAADDEKTHALHVLELDGEVAWEAILAQYRRLAAAHHPDRGGSATRFAEVRKAYEVLKRRLGP